MQRKKILVAIVLCLAMALGWFLFVKDQAQMALAYKENITQADEWVKAGLYQRAINKYQEAIAYKSTVENWQKLLDAYEKRLKEDDKIASEYEDAMAKAVESCPMEEAFYKKISDYYCEEKEYQNAYEWLSKARKAKLEDDYLKQQYFKVAYVYELQTHEYKEFVGEANGAYAVTNGYEWHTIGTDGNEIEEETYEYISLAGDEGISVKTFETDSRLINREGTVLGIFQEKCEAAGVYAQGMIPVKYQGKYGYYDEFAKKQFGTFDQAGTFYDGSAATCIDGKWEMIDGNGEKTGETFADIKLDKEGCYNRQDVILAAKQPGEYRLYKKKNWKAIGDFVCENMDICTEDGLIAYQKGNQWGYVDIEGNIVIEPQYERAKSFSNGLAAVQMDGAWGFIDTDNRLVIENVFLDADYFNESGCCMVSIQAEPEDEIKTEAEETKEPEKPIWRLLELKVKR